MQAIPILGGLLVLTLGQAAPTPIYQAVVVLHETEVRCRPGTGAQIYATNRLHQNDPVQVVRELSDGWLEILPPPGSFSWINKREITNEGFPNHPHNWVIKSNGRSQVPVFIGSDVTPGTRGTVVGVQLKPGYQMPSAFGRTEVSDQEGTWLPIEAPLGELRFIRADAVKKTGATVASGTPYPTGAPFGPGASYTASASPVGLPPPLPGAYQPPPPATEAERLWQRAQQAERMGNVNEAIQLYSQLASQSAGTSHELAMQGLNRAYWLRESQRNSGLPTVPAVQPQMVQATPTSATRYGSQNVNQVSIPPIYVNPQGGTEAASSFAPASTQTLVSQSARSSSANGAPWQAVTPEGYPSSGPGRLRRAGRLLDGRKSYVLESSQNYPMLYCTPHSGIDLEAFVNQNVELFGPAVYRGDLRANYMTVVRVQPMP